MKRLYILLGCLAICCTTQMGVAQQHRTLFEYLNDSNVVARRATKNNLDTVAIQQDSIAPKVGTTIPLFSSNRHAVGVSSNRVATETAWRDSVAIDFESSIAILIYEKILTDRVESFLLRNYTPFRIEDIHLRIRYNTPDGVMINYRDVELQEEVLPHSTKAFTIESFDKSKQYFYIDNTLKPKESGYPFVVEIELLNYSIVVTPDNYAAIRGDGGEQ